MTTLEEIRLELESLRTRFATPDADLVDRFFLHRLSRWREDDSTADQLVADLDHTLGNIWFSSAEGHALVALSIARLRDTVAALGGMTMNERLFTMDLEDRWDRASDAERDILYAKVLAKR